VNITWKIFDDAFLAVGDDGFDMFSVCKRNGTVHDGNCGGSKPPHTRWCVFDDDTLEGYCGDIPIDLDEESVKAMAITLWRMRDNK
jgi:hypothetical protein